MLKLIAPIVIAGSLLIVVPAHATRQSGSVLCVGSKSGCFSTVQAAVDAAHDGDTIRIGAGTFTGGVTVTKSISLVGSGARATVLRGGGPVLTIGEYLAPAQPSVSIAGVTITGGLSTSSPESNDFVGADNVIALGGGIAINPGDGYTTGATVAVSDSVVTGNRAEPTTTLPIGPACPGGPCTFAWAKGGGIDNWGTLTLTNTTVSNNTAAGVASDADGGGINNWSPGTLTVTNSAITGNRAIATVPNGRFAEGGGIFSDGGVQVTIRGSNVSGNTASLTSTLPYFVPGEDPIDMNANGGGIHVGDHSTISIRDSLLNGNTVSVDDPFGEPYAFDAALHPGENESTVELRNSVLDGNRVSANVGSTADVGPSGSALDLSGKSVTVANTRITRTSTVVTSHAGDADATGAVYMGSTGGTALVTDTVIAGNNARATSDSGQASVRGGGIVNDGLLLLRNVAILGNTGEATGATGFLQGGGIWSGSLFNSPPIQLTLQNTVVSGNSLRAHGALTVQGGGLFTAFPVTLTNSRIVGNAPDQCSGC